MLRKSRMEIWKDLSEMYADSSSYGGLSQLDHALQAAYSARQSGASTEAIVAALLHDVGWKLSNTAPFKIDDRAKKKQKLDDNDTSGDCVPTKGSLAETLGILTVCSAESGDREAQRAQHDVIGATYVRMLGFDERVAHLIEGHVLAKRYLCFKEKDYYEKLSPGSKRTLTFQGGIMNESEASLFEKDFFFETSKLMRRWDEAAKVPFKKVPAWDTYRDDVLRCLVGPQGRSAKDTLSTCSWIRNGNRLVSLRFLNEKKEDEEDSKLNQDIKSLTGGCGVCRNGTIDDVLSLNEAQRWTREKLRLWWRLEIQEDGLLILKRTLIAKNFKSAMSFLNSCGEIAEKMGHHPDLHLTSYRTVSVVIYTHKLGGLTIGDFELARRIDQDIDCVIYSPKWRRENDWMFRER